MKNKCFMAMDIYISSDIDLEISEIEENICGFYNSKPSPFLSRSFCSFMYSESDLDEDLLSQIGKVSNIDISTIKAMWYYSDLEDMETIIEREKEMDSLTESEVEKIIQEHQKCYDAIQNNICDVLKTIEKLKTGLEKIDNLGDKLDGNYDWFRNNKCYFMNQKEERFTNSKGDFLLHDLMNLLFYINFLETYGGKTVWFEAV